MIAMFVLACEITIGGFVFRQVNEVKIEKSWRQIGSTCTIKLPKYVRSNQNSTRTLEDFIAVGNPVTVKLRYVGLREVTEFTGWVNKIKPNIPFEIECEDDVYWMKRTPVAKTWKKEEKATLKSVVKYLVDLVNGQYDNANITISSDLPDVEFTTDKGFTIPAGNNVATALDKIRESFGLTSYLRGKELFTGLTYQKTYGIVKHSLAWNVIDSSLIYRRAEDTRIRIKPIGITKGNHKVEVTDIIGDKDGDLRTIHYYNIIEQKQLLELAKNDLKKYKFDGFEGSFDTFLYPFCEPLMITELTDPVYDHSRDGRYIIDSVVTTFGANGARRTIEPGIKVSV